MLDLGYWNKIKCKICNWKGEGGNEGDEGELKHSVYQIWIRRFGNWSYRGDQLKIWVAKIGTLK